MGCGSSHMGWVPKSEEQLDYMKYDGFGTDYVNYPYLDSYFTESDSRKAWNEYSGLLEYQKRLGQYNDDHQSEDAYNQYKQWHEHQPQKTLKSISSQPTNENNKVFVKEEEQTVNLVIEPSCTELNSQDEDERDCVAEDPVKLRMGLKTIGTALRITIIKHKPEPYIGPDQMKVTVIDTIRNPNTEFLTRRPILFGDQKYVDTEFLCSDALGTYGSKYEWKRPQDIVGDKEIVLFHEGTSLDDIDQGIFGTCYFLATLAGLAEQPEIMKQIIFPDAYNITIGVFHCRFWKLGQWVDVYTDDFLPCDDEGLVGCKSKNYAGEMWVPLIEKAYAKFMGSYPDIEGGTPRDAYLALTGGCAEWLALSYYKFDSAAVYNRIANALKHGSVVVCSSTPKDDILLTEIEDKGVLANHAYTVTATAVVERDDANLQESLVKLRNPWSHKEWTGAWGDHSPEWYTVNEAQRHQLREIEDDGEFWMPWTEFWRIFTDLTVCFISPDYDSDGLNDGLDNICSIYSEWREECSGGWQDVERNPTYEFLVPKNAKRPVNILVESIQKLPPRVHKTTAGNILLKDVYNSNVNSEYLGADTLTYTTANPITRRFEVKPGGRYHIIPTKYEAGETGTFLLRVFSKQPIDIRPVKKLLSTMH